MIRPKKICKIWEEAQGHIHFHHGTSHREMKTLLSWAGGCGADRWSRNKARVGNCRKFLIIWILYIWGSAAL